MTPLLWSWRGRWTNCRGSTLCRHSDLTPAGRCKYCRGDGKRPGVQVGEETKSRCCHSTPVSGHHWAAFWHYRLVYFLAFYRRNYTVCSLFFFFFLVCLFSLQVIILRNLYAGQEATVRTGHGTMNWFKNWERHTSRLYIVSMLI